MCKAMNCESICSYDIGVAGMHQIVSSIERIDFKRCRCNNYSCWNGRSIATVVSSLVDIPVIGVPSSVGYGYGSKGVAALAAMLQSCALGMSVVNIDNGIGAGAVAANICRRINLKKKIKKNLKLENQP